MVVYRISECRYIKSLSGVGAALFGGRWNSKDVYMVYTSQSGALAMLEAIVHIGKVPKPGLYCMATIEIPDDSIETLKLEMLPAEWQNNPPPNNLKSIGDRFIESNKYAALKVPSVFITDEHNYLLNPAHPEFKKVRITSEKPIRIDNRLLSA